MEVRRVRDIDYQLLPGTERKTTDIVIERNGTVVVRPPKDLSPEHVDAVVESKRVWIYRNLAEWRDLNASAVVREWVNGEAFLYLGRSYRLSLVDGQERPLVLKNGRFCLDRQLIEASGVAAAKKAFEDYYSERALERISRQVHHFAPKVGKTPSGLVIKDLGHRWATCSKHDKLAFHWKCIMAPPTIVDYFVVHELCHMRHRDHTDAFWNEVDKVLPDYKDRVRWLKQFGASLDI